MPGKPDAILFHSSHKEGTTIRQRIVNVQKAFGPVLGGDQFTELGPQFGGRVYSREVGGQWYLATLHHGDTLLYPNDHDKAKQPRYDWEVQPDGTRHGYLKDRPAGGPESQKTRVEPEPLVKAVAPSVKLGK